MRRAAAGVPSQTISHAGVLRKPTDAAAVWMLI
jgi:hypothetical protein